MRITNITRSVTGQGGIWNYTRDYDETHEEEFRTAMRSLDNFPKLVKVDFVFTRQFEMRGILRTVS
jgi:hypothetical protein